MCPTDRTRQPVLVRNIDYLKAAFSVLDRDGDGIIKTSDLENFFQDVVACKLNTKEDVESMLASGEGNVDFEQFLSLINFQPETRLSVSVSERGMDDDEGLITMFEVLDKNGDGFICESDLKAITRALVGRLLSEKDIQAMLSGRGVGGKVAYEEFVTLMTFPGRSMTNGISLLQPRKIRESDR